MALRSLNWLLAIDRGQCVVKGSFLPNGSSQPVAASNKGQGFTVARTGTGTFTVTLTEPFADIIGAVALLSLGTPGNSFVQCNGWAKNASNRYVFTFTTFTAGAAADIAAASNNVITFDITAQHSGSKPY